MSYLVGAARDTNGNLVWVSSHVYEALPEVIEVMVPSVCTTKTSSDGLVTATGYVVFCPDLGSALEYADSLEIQLQAIKLLRALLDRMP
jgi:predicted RNA-binding protein with TRAM domain